ncbi:MAG: hypothetical protein KDB60_18375, partial [Propionibacteriaceae bacterium]|nr:hypothetical protein [Propionibacteriaceae bacterium]
DWPAGGTDPFDPGDDGALWFYWAHERPSLAFRKRELDLHDDLPNAIPPGRTTLELLVRTAILDRGRVVADWTDGQDPLGSHALILPGERYLHLGTGSPVRFALDVAGELSRRVAAPVLLARVEWTRDWA